MPRSHLKPETDSKLASREVIDIEIQHQPAIRGLLRCRTVHSYSIWTAPILRALGREQFGKYARHGPPAYSQIPRQTITIVLTSRGITTSHGRRSETLLDVAIVFCDWESVVNRLLTLYGMRLEPRIKTRIKETKEAIGPRKQNASSATYEKWKARFGDTAESISASWIQRSN